MTVENESFIHRPKARANMALLVFLAIAGYFLLTEHWAHAVQSLPYLLVLGSIVMYLFMHVGHGKGSDSGSGQVGRTRAQGNKDEQ